MGPWHPLWVLFALLRALQGQTPTPVSTTATVRITPRLVTFQQGKFQGEWFVLGLAGSSYGKEDRKVLNHYTMTFELKKDNTFEVWYAMTRGQHCHSWSYTLRLAGRPGHFTVDSGAQSHSEEVQVFDSDYRSFAVLLWRRVTHGQELLRINLLGRTWTLSLEMMDKFICVARAHHLSDDNVVFPEVIVWVPAPDSC
ncbi:epididymal-specific lipocalin-12 [Tamandua tetradactyla]|uniref:epididymal-specific lipocalin-12 n=1 Tax=Tamandua tetradactyla TaxID=48850 RepID=UPI004053A3F7